MIADLKSRDYSERLKELGLTTLEERRHQLDMVQVYKIGNGVGGVNSEQWFKMAENVRETRRTDPTNIRIQAARLEVRRNFFSHSAGGLEQRPRRNSAGKDCPGF